jgi:membrane protein
MQTMIEKLHGTAFGGLGVFSASAGACWAAVNGSWAVMAGLNTAYEVKERRPLWKVVGIAFLLTMCLAIMFLIALSVTAYGLDGLQMLARQLGLDAPLPFLIGCVQWPVLVGLLLASFALFYRFGPNLYDRQWQWSTPGAVLALLLWLLATALVRLYFERFHSYHVVYGPLEGVAMLLLWLYFTSAAILIGGEMNSEIEKAMEQKGGSKTPAHHSREGA